MDKRLVSIKGFKDLLALGGVIETLTIEDDVEIKGGIDGLHLKKVVFEKQVTFNGIVVNDRVVFDECEFVSGISFSNISFSSGIEIRNCNCKNMTFTSCAFDELLIENGTYDKIEIKNIVKEIANGNNAISLKAIQCASLLIKAKEINSSIVLSASNFVDVTFQNTNVRGSLHFTDDTKISTFHAQSCYFYNRIDFGKSEFENSLWIHKCSFEEQVIFTKNFKCNHLTLANITGKQSVSLDYASNIETLDISDSVFNFDCSLAQDHIVDGNSLSLNINGVINGNLVFSDLPITSIFISAINFGNIILDNIWIKLIFFKNFHNRNRLSMSNFKLNAKYNAFVIFDSNINQSEFTNIDFNKFSEVVIAKSEVSNMILSNSRLPETLQIETVEPLLGYLIPEQDRTKKNLYLKEGYRQLKIAMEKHGNRKEALHFQSLEMYYLRKELPFSWDSLLLFLNYISNNHGASWIKSVLFTILVSFMFFCLYNEVSENPFFYWNYKASVNDIRLGFRSGLIGFTSYWASFPVLNFNNNIQPSWEVNLVLFFSRIFIGYGIYQTITAFRKYAR